eukprot:6084762-Lingulodinium_polyedra.AAC.1
MKTLLSFRAGCWRVATQNGCFAHKHPRGPLPSSGGTQRSPRRPAGKTPIVGCDPKKHTRND